MNQFPYVVVEIFSVEFDPVFKSDILLFLFCNQTTRLSFKRTSIISTRIFTDNMKHKCMQYEMQIGPESRLV